MLRKEYKLLLLLFIVAGIFFYQFFLGKIPFPGDLLISEYNPWKTYSFLGFAPGGFPNKAQYFDVLRQLYPWRVLAIESFRNFHIPLWNPYNFAGTPFLANDQSAVWYPFNLLYLLFPQTVAWGMLIVLQPLLASIGTYFFARKIGIKKWGSLLASIAYGYCLFQSVFLEYNTIGHCIALLPWPLLGIELLVQKNKILGSLIFVGSLVFSFFAGHIQIWGFSFIFILAYGLFAVFSRQNKVRFGLNLLVLFLISFLLISIQLIPTLELIHNAARVSQNYQFLLQNLLIQPYQLFVLAIPDIFGNPATRNYLLTDSYPGNAMYIGIVPLIFALFSLFLMKVNKVLVFFWVSVGVLLLFLIRSPFSEIFYRLQIPFFSTGSPSNALYLLSFTLAVLSGFGLDYFIQQKDKKVFYILLSLTLVFLFSITISKIFHIQINFKNILFSFVVFLCASVIISVGFFLRKKIILLTLILLLITVGDLFYFFHKFNPFVSPSLVYPPVGILTSLQKLAGNERVWSYGDAYIEPNVLEMYHLQDPNGYDPLYPKTYGEFVSSSEDGVMHTQFTNQSRSDAVIAPAFKEDDLAKNPYRFKVLDALSVSYVLSKESLSPDFLNKNNWKLAASQNGWYIYKNNVALPHAYLVNTVQTYNTPQEFAQKFYADSFNVHSTALLDENLPKLSGSSGQANIMKYSPEEVEIQTKTNGNQLLVLTDTYFPGWKATVDGREVPIMKANFTFRAVAVPSGTHTIIFSYQPASFSLGLTLTIMGLGGFVLFLIVAKRGTVS